MNKMLVALATATAVAAPALAAPTNFAGSYTITANSGGAGLIVGTNGTSTGGNVLGNPFAFALDGVGDSTERYNLFDIFTPEASIELDDVLPINLTLDWDFVQPAPGFAGVATGLTSATIGLGTTGAGNLDWDNNGNFFFTFGALGDGVLGLNLTGGTFNRGTACSVRVFGVCILRNPVDLDPGQAGLRRVTAQFTLLQEATEVPEPAMIGLLGMGILGIATTRRRRAA